MASRRRCPVLTDARGFREEEKGREEGETGGGGGEGKGVELGFEDGAAGLVLRRGKEGAGPRWRWRRAAALSCFRRGGSDDDAVTVGTTGPCGLGS